MQKYEKTFSNLADYYEISGYMLLKLNVNQVQMMSKFGLNVDDVKYIPMFEEYLAMRMNGAKVTQIIVRLSETYYLSESTVKRVIRRLSNRVKL